MKIINQLLTGDYTVIEVSEKLNFGKYAIREGSKYNTEIVYDLPNHIAIKALGDFVGKTVTFSDQ
ncbi:hypothetical protein [Faecalicoccus pleomorphus]|uniref:hypothetical protein n=1 Tax=Faecalicoccus pleomorphus TaxID=1323 RepID=UPI0025A3F3E7|nr:hypothetical protein [Faecalicoccus pleomorphus]MDM8293467.1 hypothetical protein [Faecalicoccus pleomorphus]